MTAIAVMPTADRLVIASDGAVCSPKGGTLLGLASKTVLIPEWSCVFVQRGAGGFAHALYMSVGWRRDFDDMLTVIGEASESLHEQYIDQYQNDCHWSMVIVGWSTARARPEMYFLRSREYEMLNTQTGAHDVIAPYQLHETWSLHAAPMPSSGLREQFGIDIAKAADLDPVEATCRLVAAARHQPNNEFCEDAECIIGGFIQSTVLTRDRITTEIVHRWPDIIGERIDPTRGEASPVFHAPPSDDQNAVQFGKAVLAAAEVAAGLQKLEKLQKDDQNGDSE
jgi:hypothetical protein